MASLLNIGRGLVNHKFLPYDAEIEYLESSGTQWIDTGVKYPTSLNFEIGFTVETYFSWGVIHNYSAGGAWIGETGGMFLIGDFLSKFSYNNFLPINDIKYKSKEGIIVNDESIKTFSIDSIRDDISNINFVLFACYDLYDNLIKNFNSTKLYSIYLKVDNALVRDFIPVRVGTTGYMYDKVSGQLFGNSGTGDFILGPDKH